MFAPCSEPLFPLPGPYKGPELYQPAREEGASPPHEDNQEGIRQVGAGLSGENPASFLKEEAM